MSSSQARWTLTFADLLSLILTFFVMIFAIADPVQMTNKFKKTQDSDLTVLQEKNAPQIRIQSDMARLGVEYTAKVLTEKFSRDKSLKQIIVKVEDDQVRMSLPDPFFDYNINTTNLTEILNGLNGKVNIYTSSLDKSYEIAEKLHKIGLTKNSGFYEQASVNEGVDIVVYP